MKQIYLDHASTTPVRPEVVEAMMPFFTEEFGNPSSIYPLGQEASDAVAEARETLAGVIGAKPREIFFTSGGTESDNWALKGFARANAAKGKHIITSAIEHHAVLHTCEALEREGFEVTYLPVDEHGLVSVEDFKAALRPDTILASIMFANNEIGVIEPIAELAAAAHEAGVTFHTDAVQAFGHEPIDVDDMGIDMLSASSHKIYGPKGVGLLYVRKGVKLQNLIDGGQQERGKRGSTENVPGIVGFAKAAELAMADLAPEHDRQLALRDHAIKRILAEIPSAKLNGSWESRLANNVNFSFEFIEGEGMLLQLAARGICVSSGSACTSGSLDPSHVLLAIGLPHEIAHGSLRMTIGRDTTQEDVNFAVDSLKTTLENLRMMSPLYEDFQQGKVESVIATMKANGFPYAN
ncbi:cysteine desulfurase NifS [uncultured Adlercreutzia sp.]|uniref:cysteine desulfurase NifS n=1 Tax=uncultured Adlercreutzia sp. TaxID=875803 RepID=UPI0025F09921|nr:cysteine desulfurase NifS [uncultured Adlercreutzia sp.]MCI9261975.1 cysteine desulfurase NifS [Eggerthellaceae bacterium]